MRVVIREDGTRSMAFKQSSMTWSYMSMRNLTSARLVKKAAFVESFIILKRPNNSVSVLHQIHFQHLTKKKKPTPLGWEGKEELTLEYKISPHQHNRQRHSTYHLYVNDSKSEVVKGKTHAFP